MTPAMICAAASVAMADSMSVSSMKGTPMTMPAARSATRACCAVRPRQQRAVR